MENKVDSERQRPYAEKFLLEKLEYVANRLRPGPGYEIGLEGIPIEGIIKKELEALFGFTLDDHIDIALEFNDEKNLLELKSVHVHLADNGQRVGLVRLPELKFVPDKTHTSAFLSQDTVMDEQTSLDLIEKLGIDVAPPTNPNEYALWRSHLLSKARAWKTSEKIEFPTRIDNSSVETTSLEKTETYNPGHLIQRSTSAKRTINAFLGTELVSSISSTIESRNHPDDREMVMYTELLTVNDGSGLTNNTLFNKPEQSVQREGIELNKESADAFSNIIGDVIAYQRQATSS